MAALIAFLVIVALLYDVGMRVLEHKPRTLLESFEWATETLSTTGYGSDNHWEHPLMVALVIVVQIVGMVLIPLVLAVFILPYLAERFEQRLPREADRELSNHVIVYRHGPAVETLLQRLGMHGIPALIAETDETSAREALDRGEHVVFSRSDDDILDVCRLGAARALVANGRDEENAGVILRARQMGFTGEIYAFVEDPSHRKPIELAGATSAYTPRHIIAAALAAHASNTLSPRLPGLEALDGIERREIRVPPRGPIAGKTLGDAAIGEQSGAVVAGQWCRSHLQTRCTGSMVIEPGAVLELVGDAASLARAEALVGGRFLRQSGPFLIAGFGEVGRKVHELLRDAGEEVRVVERKPAPNVDVAGDVLDPSVLDRAGLRESRAIVLALDSDDATLFAAVIARDVVPDVPVIARVNHARNLANIHRAGADFALSISDISGEMLSSRLLGRGARARDEHRRVQRLTRPAWGGRRVDQLPLREAGCSLVAVERAGARFPVTAALQLHPDDVLWICGTTDALHTITSVA